MCATDEISGLSTAPQGSSATALDAQAAAPLVEALIFSSDRPVGLPRIAEAIGLDGDVDEDPIETPPAVDVGTGGGGGGKGRRSRGAGRPRPGAIVRDAVAILNASYDQAGRAFRIEAVAGGYRVMILSKFAAVLAAYHGARARTALSRAAVETLAIVAYKQPITRAKLEAVRGVACGEILRSLIERNLVAISGRAEELGRPLLYGTTKRFLEAFGLSSLKDLPSLDELRQRATTVEIAPAEPELVVRPTATEPAATESV